MYARIESTWWCGRLRGASDAACRLYCYLHAPPHGNRIGLYRLPVPYIMEDLDWGKRKAEDTIQELTKSGLIDYDWEGRCVFIPDYIELNSLKIGGREKTALRDLVELPPTRLLHSLHRRLAEQGGLEDFVEAVEEEIQRRRIGRTEELTLEGINVERKDVSESCAHSDGDNASIMPGTPSKSKSKSKSKREREEEEKKKWNPKVNEVIDYLNAVTDQAFRHVDGNQRNIRARLKDGATVDDLKAIVDHKTMQWGGTEQEQYLRPLTLFGRTTTFDGYLASAIKWVKAGCPEEGTSGELKRTLQEAEDWAKGR